MSNGQTLTLRSALEGRINRAFAEVEDVARALGYKPEDAVSERIADLYDAVWAKGQLEIALLENKK